MVNDVGICGRKDGEGEERGGAQEVVRWDREHVWHPFTQMAEWMQRDPVVLVEGKGARVRDAQGRWYVDGNASIWTNLHGHRHPRLDEAVRRQLDRVAHTSFLGFTNPLAAQLCAELSALWPPGALPRVFLTDDGSTAVEVALKMAAQAWQQMGRPERRRFVAFEGAYHGDTLGASSLGGIRQFHERFGAWQFPVERVSDAEGLSRVEGVEEVAGVVIEPLVQGANEMRLWPEGLLREVRRWCDAHGVFLIADEVMTGFGRTGTMFACEREGVVPDFVALAKGLTGGYMPLAATLTTQRVFEAFLGGRDRTLYYGHSYAGHALGCAVALENLAIFREERVLEGVRWRSERMGVLMEERLRGLPWVWEIRQCGLIAGIELRREDGQRFGSEERVGERVCVEARRWGLLTRPIRDTVVLMPPYCITEEELRQAVEALGRAIESCLLGKETK